MQRVLEVNRGRAVAFKLPCVQRDAEAIQLALRGPDHAEVPGLGGLGGQVLVALRGDGLLGFEDTGHRIVNRGEPTDRGSVELIKRGLQEALAPTGADDEGIVHRRPADTDLGHEGRVFGGHEVLIATGEIERQTAGTLDRIFLAEDRDLKLRVVGGDLALAGDGRLRRGGQDFAGLNGGVRVLRDGLTAIIGADGEADAARGGIHQFARGQADAAVKQARAVVVALILRGEGDRSGVGRDRIAEVTERIVGRGAADEIRAGGIVDRIIGVQGTQQARGGDQAVVLRVLDRAIPADGIEGEFVGDVVEAQSAGHGEGRVVGLKNTVTEFGEPDARTARNILVEGIERVESARRRSAAETPGDFRGGEDRIGGVGRDHDGGLAGRGEIAGGVGGQFVVLGDSFIHGIAEDIEVLAQVAFPGDKHAATANFGIRTGEFVEVEPGRPTGGVGVLAGREEAIVGSVPVARSRLADVAIENRTGRGEERIGGGIGSPVDRDGGTGREAKSQQYGVAGHLEVRRRGVRAEERRELRVGPVAIEDRLAHRIVGAKRDAAGIGGDAIHEAGIEIP